MSPTFPRISPSLCNYMFSGLSAHFNCTFVVHFLCTQPLAEDSAGTGTQWLFVLGGSRHRWTRRVLVEPPKFGQVGVACLLQMGILRLSEGRGALSQTHAPGQWWLRWEPRCRWLWRSRSPRRSQTAFRGRSRCRCAEFSRMASRWPRPRGCSQMPRASELERVVEDIVLPFHPALALAFISRGLGPPEPARTRPRGRGFPATEMFGCLCSLS